MPALDVIPAASSKEVEIRESGGRYAFFVSAGIFLSKISGFVRERALAQFLGTSNAAAAFVVALRIPNFLQNLFGEGAIVAGIFLTFWVATIGGSYWMLERG